MFQDPDLLNHIETSSSIKTQSAVIAEWNMNIPTNMFTIGNYRYRPTSTSPSDLQYTSLPNTFDLNDEGNYYTGATYADVVVDGGFDEDDLPVTFISEKKKENLLYSLEDCFGKFRPRSGINKLRYFDGKVTHHTNIKRQLKIESAAFCWRGCNIGQWSSLSLLRELPQYSAECKKVKRNSF